MIHQRPPFRIFLADDDDDDRKIFAEALNELPLNCEVINFTDGIHLMAQLMIKSTVLPEIIFLDINMPLMDGQTCLKKIMEIEKLVAIPVVIYSTSLRKREVAVFEKMGAARYLKKPTSFNQLKTLLYRCIFPFYSSNGQLKDDKAVFLVEL